MVKVGDDVRYTKLFLRSIGATATDPLWRARGCVVEVTASGDWAFAQIKWNDPDVPERVNVFNIARVGSLRLYEEIRP